REERGDRPMTKRGLARLISPGGASFALLPVPELAALAAQDASSMRVDLELLSPDRLVRYLSRRITPASLSELADAYLAAADKPYPEQSVPSVASQDAGLTVQFVASDEFAVEVEILVVADPDE